MPILEKAHIDLEIKKTSRANEAFDMMKALTPNCYDGIVTVSGDGLIHEVINGLFANSDPTVRRDIPIGILPGGTSNGLIKSILDHCNEAYCPRSAAFLIAKGFHSKMDTMEITLDNLDRKIYSHLSVTWGLIADIDI